MRLKKKLNVNTQLIVNFIALAFIIILELLYIYVLHNCYIWIFRSSHRKYSVIKGVLRNFTRFNGKNTCVRVCFLIKSACKFIKKETLAHVFSCDVNFAKFLRTPFLQNTSGQLPLDIMSLNFRSDVIIFWILGKNPPPTPPGKKLPDSKRNPIPNLTLSLTWRFFPDTYILTFNLTDEDKMMEYDETSSKFQFLLFMI